MTVLWKGYVEKFTGTRKVNATWNKRYLVIYEWGGAYADSDTLSLRPLVFGLSGILSDDECSAMKASARANGLFPSGVAHVDSARAAGKGPSPRTPRRPPRRAPPIHDLCSTATSLSPLLSAETAPLRPP